MSEEIKTQNRNIPAFSEETGKREVNTSGKSVLEIVNESLLEYRTSIKSELSKMEQRIVALEK